MFHSNSADLNRRIMQANYLDPVAQNQWTDAMRFGCQAQLNAE